jgi:hypothetical protein
MTPLPSKYFEQCWKMSCCTSSTAVRTFLTKYTIFAGHFPTACRKFLSSYCTHWNVMFYIWLTQSRNLIFAFYCYARREYILLTWFWLCLEKTLKFMLYLYLIIDLISSFLLTCYRALTNILAIFVHLLECLLPIWETYAIVSPVCKLPVL